MDAKQKRLVRNIVSGTVLLVLLLLVLAYCGVFEGTQSDEAQIRELIERSKEEANDRDWEDFLDLCDVPSSERQAWLDAINKTMEETQGAKLVQIDSVTPTEMISVPAGATEYQLDASVIGHLEAPVIGAVGRPFEAVEGTYFFVKKQGRWYIDLDRSSSTFPYVPKPKK
jgi:hypothetical protein